MWVSDCLIDYLLAQIAIAVTSSLQPCVTMHSYPEAEFDEGSICLELVPQLTLAFVSLHAPPTANSPLSQIATEPFPKVGLSDPAGDMTCLNFSSGGLSIYN